MDDFDGIRGELDPEYGNLLEEYSGNLLEEYSGNLWEEYSGNILESSFDEREHAHIDWPNDTQVGPYDPTFTPTSTTHTNATAFTRSDYGHSQDPSLSLSGRRTRRRGPSMSSRPVISRTRNGVPPPLDTRASSGMAGRAFIEPEEHTGDDEVELSSADEFVAASSHVDSASSASPRSRRKAVGHRKRHTEEDEGDESYLPDADLAHVLRMRHNVRTMSDEGTTFTSFRVGTMKRSWEIAENTERRDLLTQVLDRAVCVILFSGDSPDPNAIDVWPQFRSASKLPIRYYLLGKDASISATLNSRSARSNLPRLRDLIRGTKDRMQSRNTNGYLGNALPLHWRPQWPAGLVPTELYEEIAGYLNRDDIKSMRLVCKEFHNHVSQVLFKTVVVPFNTEIYGMLGQEKQDLKGKKKVKVENKTLPWKNANGDDVYNGHGLDVFRVFGDHMRKFGMTFEVTEDALAKPAKKCLTERHTSFWGGYDWPYLEYRRFDDVAGLETAADETPLMTIAFSQLSKVRELALSIDSGLGWLNGPDRSIRARVLQRPPEVFGTSEALPDRRTQAQQELWKHIVSCHERAGSDVKLATLYKLDTTQNLTELQGAPSLLPEQPELPFLEPHLIHQAVPYDTADILVPSSLDELEDLSRFAVTPSVIKTGILYTSTDAPSDSGQLVGPIIPTSLTKAQKEWLLEMEWAQRAFLASYMLSIIDNPRTFSLVHTLNISQLSDRYIGVLNRRDFWDALQNLRTVTLLVSPGWRTVNKDEAGFVETPMVDPSSAIDPFYGLLQNIISKRRNIQHVTIGWVTGGEHAEGIHARNKLILPAPLLPQQIATEQDQGVVEDSIVFFPYIEKLTLKNCWMTPSLLEQLVKQHDKFKLRYLTLDSVSLTGLMRNVDNGNPHHAPLVVAGAALGALNQHLGMQIQTVQLQIQQLQAQGGGHGQPQLAQLQAQLQVHLQLLHQMQAPPPMQLQQQQQQNQPLHPAGPHQHGFHHPIQMPIQQQQHVQAPPLQIQQQMQAAQVQHLQQLQLQLQQQPQPQQDAQAALRAEPRVGSWLSLLDAISPGLNLSDFGSGFSHADPERVTSLECIRFISCGYARLPHLQLPQIFMDPHAFLGLSSTAGRRYVALGPAMLSAKWPLLGEIVQVVDPMELAALYAGWELETGWKDAEAAQGPEFDGLMPGGTGRFTGVVEKRRPSAVGEDWA